MQQNRLSRAKNATNESSKTDKVLSCLGRAVGISRENGSGAGQKTLRGHCGEPGVVLRGSDPPRQGVIKPRDSVFDD